MATFENCEIFSTYYFSCVRGYKAALTGGNKYLWAILFIVITRRISMFGKKMQSRKKWILIYYSKHWGKKKRIYGIAKTMFEFEDQKLQSSAKYFWKNTFRVKTIVPLLTLSKTWLRIGSLPCLNSANIYLFELKNRNTRKRCEICSEFNNDVILVFFF